MKKIQQITMLCLCLLAVANSFANTPLFPKGKQNSNDTMPLLGKYNVADLLPITRYDGVGVGSHFVEMQDSMYQKILSGNFNGAITYKANNAPIEVKVINPLALKEGDYEVAFFDKIMTDNELAIDAQWKLTRKGDPASVISTKSIATLNEQLIPQYGLSISIGQTKKPAADPLNIPNNGAIGGTITYKDVTKPKWFEAIVDKDDTPFDFIKTGVYDPNNQFAQNFVHGRWYPYAVCDYKPRTSGTITLPYITPAWHNNKNANYYIPSKNGLISVNNIDLIFTPDKSKWSRCPVVETNNKMYTDDGLPAKGGVGNMSLRSDFSIGTDTNPDAPTDSTRGKSWFPGYAVDVETGQRLMVFFGENSGYDFVENPLLGQVYQFSQTPTGGDMIWNPTADVIVKNINNDTTAISASRLVAGCGHYIYVTDLPYDDWKIPYDALTASPNAQQSLIKNIRWASMPFLPKGINLLSYQDGLIPNECNIKLRVDNPYQVSKGVGTNGFHPAYHFRIDKKGIMSIKENKLQSIDNEPLVIYPNPINNTQTLRVNSKTTITGARIYTQEGREIHRFESSQLPLENAPLEWNLAAAKLPSGIYFIVVKTTKGWNTGRFVVQE